MIRAHSIQLYGQFPPYQRGTASMGWGIANARYQQEWALTRSGLCLFYKEFDEDRYPCRVPEDYVAPDVQLKPDEWMAYEWAIRTFIEFFLFMARFVEEYAGEESVTYAIAAGPLSGRQLVSGIGGSVLRIPEPEPCVAREFRYSCGLPCTEIRTTWEDRCAEAMKEFFQLFPGTRIGVATLKKWIANFLNRQF